MSVLTWGKPNLFVKNLDEGDANWTKLDTPKEDTTELTPTKGDALEATEEGGAIVDKKAKKSTYELAYQIFQKIGKALPFTSIDGVIEGNWAIAVQPEDTTGPGIYIGKSSISAEESYTPADGALVTYTHSAVVPEGDDVAKTTDKAGNTVYQQFCWKVIKATAAADSKYTLVFTDPE